MNPGAIELHNLPVNIEKVKKAEVEKPDNISSIEKINCRDILLCFKDKNF